MGRASENKIVNSRMVWAGVAAVVGATDKGLDRVCEGRAERTPNSAERGSHDPTHVPTEIGFNSLDLFKNGWCRSLCCVLKVQKATTKES